jgi:hypothetical protein
VWTAAYKTVMKTANQSSCALRREWELVRHTPRLMSYRSPSITNTQVIYIVEV